MAHAHGYLGQPASSTSAPRAAPLPPHFSRTAAGASAHAKLMSPPVQAILHAGAEHNLRHATSLGLVSMNGSQPVAGPRALQTPTLVKLDRETELCWVAAGRTAEKMGNTQKAVSCWETALQHNPQNADALASLGNVLRNQEDFARAAEHYTRALAVRDTDGEAWGALGHCYLMTDDLPKAYNCYQQAIVNSVDSKNEPKLWYGIGILYDRYGSLEHAEEAFASVIKMNPNFDKANEIYFRLGIIYKQQKNSRASLQCFRYILSDPPKPLTEIDIWFQIGHVYEQQHDFDAAKDAYDRVLAANPNHAKVLQQLGGLLLRQRASFYDPERSVAILTKSLEHDPGDAFSWYLLGRAYMTSGNFGKAYEAYQQAVYRDGKNPAFWCSIGVLYCNINQFHDSLDAYSRAIRINPYLSEVWFNLGALYESCNDQMSDAVDAYQRTLQLDAGNVVVQSRLEEIRNHQQRGVPLTAPPQPRDISPSSTSWLLASHVSPSMDGTSDGHPEHETHANNGHGHVAARNHMSPPPIAAYDQHAGFSRFQQTTDAPGRRASVGLPHASNGFEGRRGSNQYTPIGGPIRERQPLPQMRPYDGVNSHAEVRAIRQLPPTTSAYGSTFNQPHSDLALDGLRGRPFRSTLPPAPKSWDPHGPSDGRQASSGPPQLNSVKLAAAAAPPPPSYGSGAALPGLASSSETERRWFSAEEEDRRRRREVAVGPARSPPLSNGRNTSPVENRKTKGRSSEGNTPASKHSGSSPHSTRQTSPAMSPRTAPAKQITDEDNDEGANALLAFAAGGSGRERAALTTLTSPPLSAKRPLPADGSEDGSHKKPRNEAVAA